MCDGARRDCARRQDGVTDGINASYGSLRQEIAWAASLGSWFESTSGYAVQGNNGCALFNGTGHRLAQGFTVSDVIIGGNGCAGGSATLNAAVDGFGQVLNGQDAQVSLSGTELRLTAGKYTLLFAAD